MHICQKELVFLFSISETVRAVYPLLPFVLTQTKLKIKRIFVF